MKVVRVAVLLVLVGAWGCKDDTRPTTCTGRRLRECAGEDFCLLIGGPDAGPGECRPTGTYSCDGTDIQTLCDAVRGEPSCAYCVVQGPDPQDISLLSCLPAAECR